MHVLPVKMSPESVVMTNNLKAAFEEHLPDITNAYEAEDRINTLRNNLRDEEIDDVENSRKNWQTSVYYMEITGCLVFFVLLP